MNECLSRSFGVWIIVCNLHVQLYLDMVLEETRSTIFVILEYYNITLLHYNAFFSSHVWQ